MTVQSSHGGMRRAVTGCRLNGAWISSGLRIISSRDQLSQQQQQQIE